DKLIIRNPSVVLRIYLNLVLVKLYFDQLWFGFRFRSPRQFNGATETNRFHHFTYARNDKRPFITNDPLTQPDLEVQRKITIDVLTKRERRLLVRFGLHRLTSFSFSCLSSWWLGRRPHPPRIWLSFSFSSLASPAE